MCTSSKRVIVIGAGIVGLSCALYAQRRGHHVVLIDPRGVAGGASSGNAGVLAVSECVPIGTPELFKQLPRLLLDPEGPLRLNWAYAPRMLKWFYHFIRSCRPDRVERAMESLASLLSHASAAHHDLAKQSECEHMIRPSGWIKAYETDTSYQAALVDIERMRRFNITCDYLNTEKLRQAQPGLPPIFKHAINLPACEHIIDPASYVRAFSKEFLKRGGEYIRAEITSLDRRGGHIHAARSGTDSYSADAYVIAAGAWSKKLSVDTGSNVPLDTERGYHIVLQCEQEDIITTPLLWSERAVILSPMSEGLRITSGVELAGLKAPPDFRRFKAIVSDMRKTFLRSPSAVSSEWLGFRPSMPDSVPVIGRAIAADNALLAFGHGHLGLTLGPVTGSIVAGLIDGRASEIDLAPYDAARFSN